MELNPEEHHPDGDPQEDLQDHLQALQEVEAPPRKGRDYNKEYKKRATTP